MIFAPHRWQWYGKIIIIKVKGFNHFQFYNNIYTLFYLQIFQSYHNEYSFENRHTLLKIYSFYTFLSSKRIVVQGVTRLIHLSRRFKTMSEFFSLPLIYLSCSINLIVLTASGILFNTTNQIFPSIFILEYWLFDQSKLGLRPDIILVLLQ